MQTQVLVAGGGGGGGSFGGGDGGAGGQLNANGSAGGGANGGGGGTSTGCVPGAPEGTGGQAVAGGVGSRGQGGGGGYGPGAWGSGGGGGYYGGCGSGGATINQTPTGGGGGGTSWANSDPQLPLVADATSAAPSPEAPHITLTYTDNTAPTVTMTDPAIGSTTNATPTLSGTAGIDTGDNSTVDVYVYYGGPGLSPDRAEHLTAPVQANGTWSVVSNPLSDAGFNGQYTSGEYTAYALQSDDAGNTGTSAVNNGIFTTYDTWTVDATPPAVVISHPTADQQLSSAPTFSGTGGTAGGDASTVNLQLYQGSKSSGTVVEAHSVGVGAGGSWSFDPGPLADGTYTLLATQTDEVNNNGRAQVTFSIDSTPPSVAITAPATGQQLGSGPAFSGTAGTGSGDTPSVSVSLYQGSAASGMAVAAQSVGVGAGEVWSFDPGPLGDGTYTLLATQTDEANNTGQAQVTFSVDNAAPDVTITAPANGLATNLSQPSITGTAGDQPKDTGPVDVALYPGGNVAGAPSFTAQLTPAAGAPFSVQVANALPDGVYTAVASQSDDTGNTGVVVSTFTVDTVAPKVTITAPADGVSYTQGDVVKSSYSCSDPGSGVARCVGAVANGSALDTSTVGDRTFTVNAIDRAGNATSTTVRYAVAAGPAGGVGGSQTNTNPGGGGGGTGTAPTGTAGSKLALLHATAKASRRGCPVPKIKLARAAAANASCRALVTLTGTIDDRARPARLTITATARGAATVRTSVTLKGKRWRARLTLPESTAGKLARWTLKVASPGNAALRAATVRRTLT